MPTSASPSTRCLLREAAAGAQAEPAVSVRVDGTGYTAKGKLLFSDVSVDPGTGQVMLRGQFSNPDGLLLPGMYVRVSAEQGVQSNAIFVPQRAVMRGADGRGQGAGRGRRQGAGASGADRRHAGSEWQITQGLAAGDQVIVDGAAKIPPGTPLRVQAAGAQAPAQQAAQ